MSDFMHFRVRKMPSVLVSVFVVAAVMAGFPSAYLGMTSIYRFPLDTLIATLTAANLWVICRGLRLRLEDSPQQHPIAIASAYGSLAFWFVIAAALVQHQWLWHPQLQASFLAVSIILALSFAIVSGRTLFLHYSPFTRPSR